MNRVRQVSVAGISVTLILFYGIFSLVSAKIGSSAPNAEPLQEVPNIEPSHEALNNAATRLAPQVVAVPMMKQERRNVLIKIKDIKLSWSRSDSNPANSVDQSPSIPVPVPAAPVRLQVHIELSIINYNDRDMYVAPEFGSIQWEDITIDLAEVLVTDEELQQVVKAGETQTRSIIFKLDPIQTAILNKSTHSIQYRIDAPSPMPSPINT